MKRLLTYILVGIALLNTSCEDFLNTIPRDALSPATTWKTEGDAEKFLMGCYDGWASASDQLYLDCGSDIGFNYHTHEGWRYIGSGAMAANNEVADLYSFAIIRRCNDFLKNIEPLQFVDPKKKANMIGQVRFIRAYQYFNMNWWYGGVPIIGLYETAEEAKVARKTENEVKQFVFDEIDLAIDELNDVPAARGYLSKGAALALKVRSALYYGDYDRSIKAAQAIIDLGQYDLDDSYENLFMLAGQNSIEIIAAVQQLQNLYENWLIGSFYNESDGGWSSVVPTRNLIDMYEMDNGLTKEEATGYYNPVHPFANRDPRMAMTVLYPGMNWNGANGLTILNTLDATIHGEKNPNDPNDKDNASKTGLTWAKYLAPREQYENVWSTSSSPIVFRFAEVLLSYAEAENELNGPSNEVYEKVNKIRNRVGMPDVDKAVYNTKEKLRELIRRERSVELAGEGLRRADILRWKDTNNKMVAETVMNGRLTRFVGTINYAETDPTKRATMDVSKSDFVENRQFAVHNRYLPIDQDAIDKNPKLKQNSGY